MTVTSHIFVGLPTWTANLTYPSTQGVARASTGTYFDASGNFQKAAINELRVDHNRTTPFASRGNLLEGGVGNYIRNPTMFGAAAGSPGTLPTRWQIQGVTTGLTRTIATGTEQNIPYIDITYSATGGAALTAVANVNIMFDGGYTTVPFTLSSSPWSISSYCKVSAGSLTNVTIARLALTVSSNSTFVAKSSDINLLTQASFTQLPANQLLANQQYSLANYTFTDGTSTAGPLIVNTLSFALSVNFGVGYVGPTTIRLALPQVENSPTVSSVVVPPSAQTGWTNLRSPDLALIPRRVSNGGNAYQLVAPGTSAASGGPTGTGVSITDNTAVWKYVAPISYTTLQAWANAIPATLVDNVIGYLWNCGPLLCVSGQNLVYLAQGTINAGNFAITLQAAPGDSFRDTLAGQQTPLYYNVNNGVSIVAPLTGTPVDYVRLLDNNYVLDGIQFQDPSSTDGSTLVSLGNNAVIRNCIFDGYTQGVSGANIVQTGFGGVAANCLIIDRNTGSFGANALQQFAVPNSGVQTILNCAFIAVSPNTNVIAYTNNSSVAQIVRNCIFIGYTGSPFGSGASYTVDHCLFSNSGMPTFGTDAGGNKYNATVANTFVSATDYRIIATSSAINGAAIDTVDLLTDIYQVWMPTCAAGTQITIEGWGSGSGGSSASGGGAGGSYALNYYTVTASDVVNGIPYNVDGASGATSGNSLAGPDSWFGSPPKNLIANSTNLGVSVANNLLPTGWSTQAGGLTITVVATGTDVGTGLSYVDINWSGTSTGASFGLVPSNNGYSSGPVNASTQYAVSLYAAVSGGSVSNISGIYVQNNWLTSALIYNGNDNTIFITPGSLTSSVARFSGSATTPAGTAIYQPFFLVLPTGAGAINVTFRFAGWQFELGATATTYQPTPAGYILAKGGPATTTSGAPSLNSGNSFGLIVYAGGAGATQAQGGGAGGAGGPDGAGVSSTSATGATGDNGIGGAAGLSKPQGGGGGSGLATGTGQAGGVPGGGGGAVTTSGSGGPGGDGRIRISYAGNVIIVSAATDIAELPRPQSTTWDIGPWEFQQAISAAFTGTLYTIASKGALQSPNPTTAIGSIFRLRAVGIVNIDLTVSQAIGIDPPSGLFLAVDPPLMSFTSVTAPGETSNTVVLTWSLALTPQTVIFSDTLSPICIASANFFNLRAQGGVSATDFVSAAASVLSLRATGVTGVANQVISSVKASILNLTGSAILVMGSIFAESGFTGISQFGSSSKTSFSVSLQWNPPGQVITLSVMGAAATFIQGTECAAAISLFKLRSAVTLTETEFWSGSVLQPLLNATVSTARLETQASGVGQIEVLQAAGVFPITSLPFSWASSILVLQSAVTTTFTFPPQQFFATNSILNLIASGVATPLLTFVASINLPFFIVASAASTTSASGSALIEVVGATVASRQSNVTTSTGGLIEFLTSSALMGGANFTSGRAPIPFRVVAQLLGLNFVSGTATYLPGPFSVAQPIPPALMAEDDTVLAADATGIVLKADISENIMVQVDLMTGAVLLLSWVGVGTVAAQPPPIVTTEAVTILPISASGQLLSSGTAFGRGTIIFTANVGVNFNFSGKASIFNLSLFKQQPGSILVDTSDLLLMIDPPSANTALEADIYFTNLIQENLNATNAIWDISASSSMFIGDVATGDNQLQFAATAQVLQTQFAQGSANIFGLSANAIVLKAGSSVGSATIEKLTTTASMGQSCPVSGSNNIFNITASAQATFPPSLAAGSSAILGLSSSGLAFVGSQVQGVDTILPITATATVSINGSRVAGHSTISFAATITAAQVISNVTCTVSILDLIADPELKLWVTPVGFYEGDLVIYWSD